MGYPPALPPVGNADATPADGGYHAEELHNKTGAALADVVAELGASPSGASVDVTARLTALDAVVAAKQAGSANLAAIAALDPSTAGVLATDGAGWLRKTYAAVKTALGLTKADVGLSNVDNTSDATKPVSAAQAAAIAVEASARGAADTALDGRLDSVEATLPNKADLVGGQLSTDQIPAIALTTYIGEAPDEATMLSLTGEPGDWCTRSDVPGSAVIVGPDPTQLSDWVVLPFGAGGVASVDGDAGPVIILPGDGAAGVATKRSLGVGATQAASGNDARLSDQRVPTALSVTDAKVAAGAAIAESKLNLASDAAAGTASRRSLGTGATQAMPGNHPVVKTTDFNGFTVLAADVDDTPAPVTMGASTVLARLAAGGIVPATPAQLRALLGSGTADATTLLRGDGAWSTPNLDFLSDVTIASVAAGHVLRHTGAGFVNSLHVLIKTVTDMAGLPGGTAPGQWYFVTDDNGGAFWYDDGTTMRKTLGLSATVAGASTFVRKTAQTDRPSTTAVTDDPHLSIPIGANKTMLFNGNFLVLGAEAGDFQWQPSAPAGAAGMFSHVAPDLSMTGAGAIGTNRYGAQTVGSGTQLKGGITTSANAPGGVSIPFRALVRNGATAGNVVIQWAQNTSSATATSVLIDSWMEGREV